MVRLKIIFIIFSTFLLILQVRNSDFSHMLQSFQSGAKVMLFYKHEWLGEWNLNVHQHYILECSVSSTLIRWNTYILSLEHKTSNMQIQFLNIQDFFFVKCTAVLRLYSMANEQFLQSGLYNPLGPFLSLFVLYAIWEGIFKISLYPPLVPLLGLLGD